MNKIKKTLLACAVAYAALSTPAFANKSFQVAPGRLEVDLNKPETKTVIIINNGSEKIRLYIEPEYIKLGKGGINIGEHNKDGVAELENLASFITVSPRVMSLEPGERRDLKVNINSQKSRTDKNAVAKTSNGDYRAHVIVKLKGTAIKKTIETGAESNVNMKLDVKFETAIAVYGRLGDSVDLRKITLPINDKGLSDVQAMTMSCNSESNSLTISNNTNYKHVIEYSLDDVKYTPFNIMRNSNRTVSVNSDLSSGEILHMRVKSSNQKLERAIKCS